MAWRLTAYLRDQLLQGCSFKKAMANCVVKVYTGAQPATAEAAPTGTLLCTYSLSSGALTREVLASGSVALTGGASGSVDTLTVNSLEIMGSSTAFNTTLAQTAQDIIDKINHNPKNHLIVASLTSTSTVTLTARPGLGSLANWTVASTATTITKTDTNLTGGVTAVNGLNWGYSTANVLAKKPTETWSGAAGNTGTAGWFRIEASVTDAGGLDSTESIPRVDGAVATSGAELNMTPTTITSGATQTISSCLITFPTA